MSKADMDTALDKIEADLGLNQDPPPSEPEPEPKIEAVDNPPGYISPEDWVKSGRSMDDWQGKNKYSEQYDLIQETRTLQTSVKEMTNLVQSTVDATTEMQQQSYEQGMTAAKAELNQAIEDDDAKAVIEARDKMDNLKPPAVTTTQQVNPIHSQFFTANPVLEQGGAQFDQVLFNEFQRIYDGRLKADGVGVSQQLSGEAIKGYMTAAYGAVKQLYPDKFESPKNSRQTPTGSQKRTTTSTNPVDNLKGMKIDRANPRDHNATMDVYEMIKAKDPKQAEAFAAKMNIGEE